MNIVEKLKNKNLHISTMESCTGGSLANYITNISDSSLIFSFGAVTYSNSFKEKFNVDKSLIDKYSVYSIEVAKSMSYNISIYSNSDIGVGITGLLGKYDKFNQSEKDNTVYIAIYSKKHNKYYDKIINVNSNDRIINKEQVINVVVDLLDEVINYE